MGIHGEWSDGQIRVQKVDHVNDDDGRLDQRVLEEMSGTCEEWLDIIVTALSFMPGKLNDAGNALVLGPVGIDPEMIGALIAAKLRNDQPYA